MSLLGNDLQLILVKLTITLVTTTCVHQFFSDLSKKKKKKKELFLGTELFNSEQNLIAISSEQIPFLLQIT